MQTSKLFSFVAGDTGTWRIDSIGQVIGESLPIAHRLSIFQGHRASEASLEAWELRGFISNIRYATQAELEALRSRQAGLGRREATCAALIPIRKSADWWSLAQDERRALIEEQSRHISVGLEYLPAIARQLYHSRDLGEPFDFLTWFEYAPQDAEAFEELVRRLRETKEWTFVEREVDIRLSLSRP